MLSYLHREQNEGGCQNRETTAYKSTDDCNASSRYSLATYFLLEALISLASGFPFTGMNDVNIQRR